MNEIPNLSAALALASQGIHIFPCSPDKTPTIQAWEQNAFNNELKIEATWRNKPTLLPAIPVGAHGLIVIDCDRKNGTDGVEAFSVICANLQIDLSTAFVVETPSNGTHVYFRSKTAFGNSPGSLPDGIDVRGTGGFVIAPGATLPDGRVYRIVQGSWDTIPELPEPLAALLRPKQAEMPSETDGEPKAAIVSDRDREYAAKALADERARLAEMRSGSRRNDALNAGSHSIGTLVGNGSLSYDDAFSALFDAATINGHVAKHGERQTRATIESGLKAGVLKPRPLGSVQTLNLSIARQSVANLVTQVVQSQGKAAVKKRTVTVIQCSAIQPRAISWLWRGFIPAGKLTLLAGAGGTGKSTLAFNFAATVSNGGVWPDGSRSNLAGNVLVWSSEDDPADTITPRLMAAGANLQHCGVISGAIDEKGQRCPFDPARDMDQLRETAQQIGGISLLIIDPIVNAVTGDMNKANEVRRSLQTFVDFAAEMNCAVVGITHFTKGSVGKNAAERVLGSGAFKDFSRMTLVAAKDEESNQRVFTRAKSNISEDTGGFNYGIEVVSLSSGISATRVVWGQPLQGSSRSILAAVEGDGSREDGDKMLAAKQFLIEALKDGPAPSREVVKNAREGYGITEDTLRRAYREIGTKPSRVGFGSNGGWMWALPLSGLARPS